MNVNCIKLQVRIRVPAYISSSCGVCQIGELRNEGSRSLFIKLPRVPSKCALIGKYVKPPSQYLLTGEKG